MLEQLQLHHQKSMHEVDNHHHKSLHKLVVVVCHIVVGHIRQYYKHSRFVQQQRKEAFRFVEVHSRHIEKVEFHTRAEKFMGPHIPTEVDNSGLNHANHIEA
nr:hypothetical protein [Tanacetum cinerariifolium]